MGNTNVLKFCNNRAQGHNSIYYLLFVNAVQSLKISPFVEATIQLTLSVFVGCVLSNKFKGATSQYFESFIR